MVSASIQNQIGPPREEHDDLITGGVNLPAGPVGREVKPGNQQVPLEVVKSSVEFLPDRGCHGDLSRTHLRTNDYERLK